jgi:flagellar basal-body rod protein FlgF
MQNSVDTIGPALQALTQQYTTITQNLAHVNTAGYKRTKVSFVQSLANQMNGTPAGSIASQSGIDFSPGGLAKTDAPLDLALDGKGFFTIDTPQGECYTRNGGFRVNQLGQLTDSLGRTVAGMNGPLVIPKNFPLGKLKISADGQITADRVTVGKLKLVDFEDPKVLQSVGGSCFTATANAIVNPAKCTVQQGFQESSNVSMVEELVGLITVSRMYEANMRTVQTHDDQSKNLLNVAMQ